MLKPIRPFIDTINPFQNRLTTGARVPKDAVNMAYYYGAPLTPRENIIFSHSGRFIYENVSQPQEMIGYVDTDNCLKVLKTGSDGNEYWDPAINSEFMDITNKFKDGVPLYNAYTFKQLHYDKLKLISASNDDEYEYDGANIDIMDINDNPLPEGFYYKLCVRRAKCPSEDLRLVHKYKNLFNVTVYTNFNLDTSFGVKCKYNACGVDDLSFNINLLPNYQEYINPQPYYRAVTSMSEAMNEPLAYYIQRDPNKFKSCNIYMQGCFPDPRNPIILDLHMDVVFNQAIAEYASSTVSLDLTGLALYNRQSAIRDELDSFEGSRQKLVPDRVIDIVAMYSDAPPYLIQRGIASVQIKITGASHHGETVRLMTRPDGLGYIYAETACDTGRISMVSDKLFKNIDGMIRGGYSLRFKDRQPILLDYPREDGPLQNWFLRVRTGYFVFNADYSGAKVKRHYYIPEYHTQRYDIDLGCPYKRVEMERPRIISQREIKLMNTPLYITLDDNARPTVDVYKLDAAGSHWYLNVAGWNKDTGIITLSDYVTDMDDIYVDYVFEEYYYVYKGSMQVFDSDLVFANLDCCPNRHHYSIETDPITGQAYKEIPSFHLINRIIYFYIRPALVENIENGHVIEYNSETIFHTFFPITETDSIKLGYLLIGKAYIRPNSSYYGLKTIDTRTRGGGIRESISETLRKELEIESDYYWDIGFWDGEAYPENAVLVVRLDRRLLKTNGGVLTEREIERKVYKHVAQGVFVIIEYVSAEQEFEIKGLEVSIQEQGKLEFKPVIWASSPLEYQPEIILIIQDIEPYDVSSSILWVKTASLPDEPVITIIQDIKPPLIQVIKE